MTPSYDPNLTTYLDESSVRLEMARAFQVCAGCRHCVDLCPSFTDMFKALDMVGEEADRMTPHLQDQIADSCYDCGSCLRGCPHSPRLESPGVDIPSLMIRHRAMSREGGLQGLRRRLADEISVRRRIMGRIVGRLSHISRSDGNKFESWFRGRPGVRSTKAQSRVAFSPSCVLEDDDLRVGIDTVKVFEHNGVECSLIDTNARCGCELLGVGDIGGYTRVASRNVRELSEVLAAGKEIVVLSPRCLDVMRSRYPEFVGGPETARVIENMYGPVEYLMLLRERQLLDVQFHGEHPESVEYRSSCPARNTGEAAASEALLRLAGIGVSRRDDCCGGSGCRDLVSLLAKGGEDIHPVQVVARAYGLAPE